MKTLWDDGLVLWVPLTNRSFVLLSVDWRKSLRMSAGLYSASSVTAVVQHVQFALLLGSSESVKLF